MKLTTIIKNYSRYPIEVVWENAKDLEHVGFLHGNTNKSFELLHVEKSPDSPHEYDLMIYRSKRKFHFINLSSFGFRKVISKNNIFQVELIPALGMRSALNSLLFANNDSEFPTLMVDEVIVEVPWFFRPLKRYLLKAMHRHARIQCQEDEPFRERRALLKKRGINLPLSIFNLSHWENVTRLFTLNLNSSLNQVLSNASDSKKMGSSASS